MKRGQKGFGAVEGLLIIIIVLLVGFIAYYVYHTRNNTNSIYNNASNESTATSSNNAYAGWKSYSDDFVSLQYPSTWSAARDDNTNLPGTKQLNVEGPNDSDVAKSTESGQGDKTTIQLQIFKNSASGQNTCNCKVYDLKDLNMSQLSSAKLAVTSDINLGGDPTTPASAMIVTTDNSARIGATKLSFDLTVKSSALEVTAQVTDNGAIGSAINDLSAFEKSQSFKDLVKILNSANFK